MSSQQASLDDNWTTSTTEPETEAEPESEEAVSAEDLPARSEVLSVDVDLDGMAFAFPTDDLPDFPHPAEIEQLTEDAEIQASTPGMEKAEEAAPLEEGKFLAMDADEVYEFLETMQKKTDHWLLNKREDLKRRHLSGGRGMAKGASLSNADKQTIAQWEHMRRQADPDYDFERVPDSTGWQDLPNADE